MSLHNEHSLPDKQPLTRQQQTILEAILFFLQKGELPTVREVGALVGLRSPATVLKHLRALEREKLISLSGKSRGIRVHPELLEQVSHDITSEARPTAASSNAPSSTSSDSAEAASFSSLAENFRIKKLPFFPLKQNKFSKQNSGVPLVGAIAAGKPFETYPEAFSLSDAFEEHGSGERGFEENQHSPPKQPEIPIDPQIFADSGELFALRVEGDSMINAGILDGDYVIIRRQNRVEEGEIAAVIINGEGTLKRWHTHSSDGSDGKKSVSLHPANERFDPIVITEDDAKDVLVFGKYVGLVRGNLRIM